ncbi:discoidin domain-containing protein [Micromonospora sp. CA-263727]|uniref:discoidin domain-containing protein n=1 Tax=Micromonospora sp. CA-263727 TaxID=3239967 RepID=UPI003D8DCFBF
MTSGDRDRAGWLTDTGRFRRIGSALNWVGERVVVVGGDPAGRVPAMAAGLSAEPDVVTVIGPLDADDDRSVIETVLPIAVPPGSRARVVVPGAGATLAGRLARELTAVLDAPRTQVLLVPGGSLFAVDGWLRHTPDGTVTPAGRRSPEPRWERDVDEFCAAEATAAGELTLLPIPAGMWLFRHSPDRSGPDLDDIVYGVPADPTRPLLVVGRPGQPDPSDDELGALLHRLAPRLRRRLVLAPYGSATPAVAVAAKLARADAHPVTVRTGLPVLASDGRPVSLAVDDRGAGWQPLATTLSCAPTGAIRLSGPVRGVDGYQPLDGNPFRLNEEWVAEVTQSGLWVRPAGQETGAQAVRTHPWDFGKLRIFVGLPGQPPSFQVLPLLGALLARLPADARRRVELAPARFVDAAGVDIAPTPTEDLTTGPVPAVQRALVLREPLPGAGGPAAAQRSVSCPVPPATRPVRSAPRADAPDGPGKAPAPTEPHGAPEPTPGDSSGQPATPVRPGDLTLALPALPMPPAAGRRPRSARRAIPVLAAVAALAGATATGYVSQPTSARSGPDEQRAQSSEPPPSPGDPALALPEPSVISTAPTPTPPIAAPSAAAASRAVPGVAASTRAPAARASRPSAPTPSRSSASPSASALPGRVNSSGRNLALAGSATASSVEAEGRLGAGQAVDGDPDTRWASAFAPDPQWLAVDLGEIWQVGQVRLRWERAYATAYRVELSADGRTWRTVHQTGSGAGGVVDIAFVRTPARYLRMVGTARDMPGYGYSIYEFEVR